MVVSENITRKRNDMLDAGKTLACLAVILIHCVFPSKIGILLRTLSKFGVPFFFAISGYFNKGPVTRKLKHIGFLCVLTELLYFVFDGARIILKNIILSPELVGGKLLTLGAIFRNVVFNSPFTRPHLWFLYALLYCYLMSAVMQRVNNKIKLVLSLTLIMAFTVTSELAGVIGINNRLDFELPTGEIAGSYIYNLFIFRAYPFFALGELLRGHEKKIIEFFTDKKLTYCAVFGSFLAVAERLLLMESQFYLGTYLFTVALFVFCIKYDGSLIQGEVWKQIVQFGRESSVYVYIIHITVYDLIRLSFSLIVTGEKTGIIQSVEVLLTIIVTCLLASAIAFAKRRKKKFSTAS